MTIDEGRPALDAARVRLNELHSMNGNTWRTIAALDDYRGIPPGSLCSYAKGREPKNPKHRRILGLSQIVEIGGKKYELKEI